MERLQKAIANAGYCSRRKAEELITEGVVKVNGVVCTTLGTTVDFGDVIEVNGKPLSRESKVYYLLNKPRNTMTTVSDDRGRPTVMEYVPSGARIYPVGRLDFDTTGALLFTNDGEMTQRLTHPSHEVDKVYIATVSGRVSDAAMVTLRNGVTLDDGTTTSPAEVTLQKFNEKQRHSIIQIVLHEGRNHQVKRMIEAIGYEVVKLHREMFAGISTIGLKQGEYRKLNPEEVAHLKQYR